MVRTSLGALLAALLVLTVGSCGWPLVSGCSGVGYYALQVPIRDLQGNPQALNATVTLYDGAYQVQASSREDPLTVYTAQDRGGRRYDIHVTKPYYADVWLRGVDTPGGGCVTGHESKPVTRVVPIVLTLAPGAPAVRSVHLLPPRVLLDRAPYPSVGTFTPYVDANPGVSRAVVWRLTGDTSSVSFDSTTGIVRYRCHARSGVLTIRALSVADSVVVGSAMIAVQGHPAVPGDPPCS